MDICICLLVYFSMLLVALLCVTFSAAQMGFDFNIPKRSTMKPFTFPVPIRTDDWLKPEGSDLFEKVFIKRQKTSSPSTSGFPFEFITPPPLDASTFWYRSSSYHIGDFKTFLESESERIREFMSWTKSTSADHTTTSSKLPSSSTESSAIQHSTLSSNVSLLTDVEQKTCGLSEAFDQDCLPWWAQLLTGCILSGKCS